MELKQAENTFAVRLYEWSFRDFVRELEEGCPLLSTLGLNNRYVAAFVSWNETLSLRERYAVARGLTRSIHKNAVRLKGEIITDEDRYWYRMVSEQRSAR